MRRYEVIITPDAQNDIENLAEFMFSNFDEEYSVWLTIRNIWQKIDSLDFVPARVHIKNNLYKTFVGHYRIIYKIIGRKVYVLRVIDMRSNNDFGL